MFSPSPTVPFWHLTGVPMKRGICISNAGRGILLGLLPPRPVVQLFSLLFVYLFFFFYLIIIIWLFSNASVRNVYRMRRWGVSAEAAVSRLAQTLWRSLQCNLCGYIWIQMAATREYRRKKQRKNPDGISDGGPLSEHPWMYDIINLTFIPFFFCIHAVSPPSTATLPCLLPSPPLAFINNYRSNLWYFQRSESQQKKRGRNARPPPVEAPLVIALHPVRVCFPWKLHQVGRQIWGQACRGAELRRRELEGEVAENTQGRKIMFYVIIFFFVKKREGQFLQRWHLQDCSSVPPGEHRT